VTPSYQTMEFLLCAVVTVSCLVGGFLFQDRALFLVSACVAVAYCSLRIRQKNAFIKLQATLLQEEPQEEA